MPKIIQYTYSTPHKVSQKYIGLHNISFETLRNVAKPYQKSKRNVIPSLGYIVNTKG
jgi:hypothetical protein